MKPVATNDPTRLRRFKFGEAGDGKPPKDMISARIRRYLRRTIAETRYGRLHHFTCRSSRLGRRILLFIVVVLAILAFYDLRKPKQRLFVTKEIIADSIARRMTQHTQDPRSWPGWQGIARIYAFGDSHIDTGFHTRGPQPDKENPLGNPGWPGRTGNHGANFLGHMAATYNKSFIKVYNYAEALSPFRVNTKSLGAPPIGLQVDPKFVGHHGSSNNLIEKSQTKKGSWGQMDSLFLLFPGIDDILFTTRDRGGGRNETTITRNIEAYGDALELLYKYGARNFLLVNIPQLEEIPFMSLTGILNYIWDLGAEIVQYNGRIAFMAHRFAERHLNANVFVFNAHNMSLAVRRDPTTFVETTSYKKMNGFCVPYAQDGWWVETASVYDSSCVYPLSGWYWRDELHFSEPFHKLMARQIVELLGDPLKRLPLEFY